MAEGEKKRKRPALSPGARIGVISDTHGYLDPAVIGLFAGVSHIIHAGDVGDAAIIAALETVAPVTAVSGNVEGDGATAALPREASGEAAGVRFVVAHKPKRLLKRLAAGRVTVGPDRGAARPRGLRPRARAVGVVGRRRALPQSRHGERSRRRG